MRAATPVVTLVSLKMEAYRPRYRPRGHIVGSAERRQEVVHGLFIRQIDHLNSSAPFIPIAVKNVVMSQRQVKQVARLNPLWIVIVVLGPGRRYPHQVGGELVCGAGVEAGKSGYLRPDGCGWGSLLAAAAEPGLELLIGGKGQSCGVILEEHAALWNGKIAVDGNGRIGGAR